MLLYLDTQKGGTDVFSKNVCAQYHVLILSCVHEPHRDAWVLIILQGCVAVLTIPATLPFEINMFGGVQKEYLRNTELALNTVNFSLSRSEVILPQQQMNLVPSAPMSPASKLVSPQWGTLQCCKLRGGDLGGEEREYSAHSELNLALITVPHCMCERASVVHRLHITCWQTEFIRCAPISGGGLRRHLADSRGSAPPNARGVRLVRPSDADSGTTLVHGTCARYSGCRCWSETQTLSRVFTRNDRAFEQA